MGSESLPASTGFVRDFTMQAHFRSDDETARRLREALEAAAACLVAPTQEAAEATFRLGAEAIYAVAERERRLSG